MRTEPRPLSWASLKHKAQKTPVKQLDLGVKLCAAEQAQWSCQGSPHHVDTTEPYLRSEHVQDAVNRPSQQQPPNQEAGQHHVGEEGAEIHYLQGRQRPPPSGTAPTTASTPLPCSQLGPMSLL